MSDVSANERHADLGIIAIMPSFGLCRADPWLADLLKRKPARLATIAMANKTARIMWAVLTRNEPYRPHAA
ncbi:hypothetical protein BZA02_1225 [Ruegeria sp. P4]|nr:hypothetical protein BZA02_1225 [Ruegeria sp. P4]